jgi:hypothetical protein
VPTGPRPDRFPPLLRRTGNDSERATTALIAARSNARADRL